MRGLSMYLPDEVVESLLQPPETLLDRTAVSARKRPRITSPARSSTRCEDDEERCLQTEVSIRYLLSYALRVVLKLISHRSNNAERLLANNNDT